MLEKQERLAVIDRATDTIEVEGRRMSFTSVQRVRDELWHNWAMSEAQVDNEIRTMFQEERFVKLFLSSFYPRKRRFSMSCDIKEVDQVTIQFAANGTVLEFSGRIDGEWTNRKELFLVGDEADLFARIADLQVNHRGA